MAAGGSAPRVGTGFSDEDVWLLGAGGRRWAALRQEGTAAAAAAAAAGKPAAT